MASWEDLAESVDREQGGQPPNSRLKSPPPLPYGLQQGRSLSETLRNAPVASPAYIGTTGVPFRAPVTQKDIGNAVGTDDRDSMLQGAMTAADPANPLMTRLGGARQAVAPLTGAAAMLGGSAIARGATAPRPVNPVSPIPPAPGISAAPTPRGGPSMGNLIRASANAYRGNLPGVVANLTANQAPTGEAATPIPQVQGSTALPGQFGRSLPPRAIPPGGPLSGTIPGVLDTGPAPAPTSQGSTAIPAQYTKSMPPQFPSRQTPVGSLPLNPPQAPPIAQGAPPVNPPTPPQGQPAPVPGSAPQGGNLGTPQGPNFGSGPRADLVDPASTPGVIDYRALQAAKVAQAQPELQARIQSGAVNPDDLTSHPDWKPNPPGKNWQQLMKDLNLGKIGTRKEGSGQINTAEATMRAMGLKWAPKPAEQAQAAAVGGPPAMQQMQQQQQRQLVNPATMSPPNIIRAVANAVPKEGIGISELRENLPQLSKQELDQAVMDLYRSNKIDLDAHDFPQGETPEDLARLTVPDGKGNFYIMAGRK